MSARNIASLAHPYSWCTAITANCSANTASLERNNRGVSSTAVGGRVACRGGFDLGRTKSPIEDIVDDFERIYPNNPILDVTEVHERLYLDL